MKNSEASIKFREKLQDEYLQRCQRNSRYTLSAFARSLKLDASTLSKIMKGQRKLGDLAIRRLAAGIGISPEEATRFIVKRKNIQKLNPDGYQQIAADQFALISDWQHYAILELMHVEGFRSNSTWIAKTLNISIAEVQISLERLQRLGLIAKNAEGKWTDQSSGFSTIVHSAFTTAAFRRMQRQILEQAITALDQVPFEKRSQSSMTMAVDPQKLPEAILLIQEFRRKLNGLLSQEGHNTAVYQLSISLFPITELENQIGDLK